MPTNTNKHFPFISNKHIRFLRLNRINSNTVDISYITHVIPHHLFFIFQGTNIGFDDTEHKTRRFYAVCTGRWHLRRCVPPGFEWSQMTQKWNLGRWVVREYEKYCFVWFDKGLINGVIEYDIIAGKQAYLCLFCCTTQTRKRFICSQS